MSTNANTEPDAVADIFASPSALRDAFEHKLGGLLEQDALGVFVLVLANASFQRSTFNRLRRPLAAAFARWNARFDAGDDRVASAPVDDVEVFQRLRRIGFERLEVTRWRRLGPWEVQFNQMRALRPARMSHAPVTGLYNPFDPEGFHFNRSFLLKEVFWEGGLAGAPVRLLYNKFPFAELHALLVPDPSACKPQSLTRDDHELVWEIALQLGRRLPGVGFAYNAYGAYASVNHLHFQMFVRSEGRYPIESSHWRHNAGNTPYPLSVRRCTDNRSAWLAVQQLHAAGHAYNLLYRPGCTYVVGRAKQGSYAQSGWTGGFAWSELAGAVTTFEADDFERLTKEDIDAELRRLSVKP